MVGVIGTACSVAAAAASPILSEAGLVMVAPTNTAPYTDFGPAGQRRAPNYYRGYYHHVANNDLYEAEAVAKFAYHDLGLREHGGLP